MEVKIKAILNRVYTEKFRQAAAKQLSEGGQRVRQLARSLEMSDKTLGRRLGQTRRGVQLIKSEAATRR